MIKKFLDAKNTLDPDMIVGALGATDAYKRHQARLALEARGSEALPIIEANANHANWRVRWEIVKAMGEIGDPRTAPLLAAALHDEETSVRWAAMESLILLGREGMRPLLETLTRDFGSARVREGVHHILHALLNQGLLTASETGVLQALEGSAPGIQAAWAANEALIAF